MLCSFIDGGILDEYVAHLVFIKELIWRHLNLAHDHTDFDRFQKGVFEELDKKGIRREFVNIVLRDLRKTYDEAMRQQKVEGENQDQLTRNEPIPQPNPPEKRNKKQKRRGDKGKGKGSAPERTKISGGRAKGVRNLVPGDFPNAIHISVRFGENMGPGCVCPNCLGGKLEWARPSSQFRFESRAPIDVVIYDVERLRCHACRQEYAAELPEDVHPEVAVAKTTPAACAQSLVLRYGMGFPDNRLDLFQAWHNIAFSNSRQWFIAKNMFESLAPVHKCLLNFVANATCRQVDDCSVRVISQQMSIAHEIHRAQEAGFQAKHVRTGLNATIFVATRGDVTYRFVQIGRAHQGEREYELALIREGDEPLIRACDAASKVNCLKPHPKENEHGFVPQGNTEKDRLKEKNVTQAFCLEHLRQTFERATPGFAREMSFLMERLVRIFELDAQASDEGLDDSARLAFHQKNSGPVIEEMLAYANTELETNKKAEPNRG